MMNIGKTIASLRKANNMTQSEVADVLGVTYQAVSKWERDESLPDITMLPRIADLFHISIDQLLRGSFEMQPNEIQQAKEIIHEAAIDDEEADAVYQNRITEMDNERFDEAMKNHEHVDSEELADMISDYFNNEFSKAFENMAPFMKPDKISKMIQRRKPKFSSFSKTSYEYLDDETINQLIESIHEVDEEILEKLIELIPQCSKESKDKIVDLMMQSDTFINLEDLLPFLDQKQIERLLRKAIENDENIDELIDNIEDYLPFLNNENKDLMIDTIISMESENIDFEDLLPFLDQKQIKRLLEKVINDDEKVDELIDNIEDYLPFLNSENKDLIIDKITSLKAEYANIENLLPFLNSNQKARLMEWACDHLEFYSIEELVPFLNSEILGRFTDRYIREGMDEDLVSFYPFLNHETKTKLMAYYVENKMMDELDDLLPYLKK